jgi:hypothetical protein
MNYRSWAAGICVLGIAISGNAIGQQEYGVLDELDGYWQEVARTVTTGNFEAYAAGYHADAIYVSESEKLSQPISLKMDGWRQGFLDTQQGKAHPALDFRFSQRLNDATSAHETGIFRYSSGNGEGSGNTVYVHFEALLIKKGRWLTVMEYQKSPATEEEWDSL